MANNCLQFTHPEDSFPSSQGQPLHRSLSQLKPVQILILFDPHNITVHLCICIAKGLFLQVLRQLMMMIVQTLTYLRSSYVLEGPAQVQFYESAVEIQIRTQWNLTHHSITAPPCYRIAVFFRHLRPTWHFIPARNHSARLKNGIYMFSCFFKTCVSVKTAQVGECM